MSFRFSCRRWARAFRPEPRRRPSVPRPSHTIRLEFLEYRVCPSTLIDATARVHQVSLCRVAPASGAASARRDPHWNSRGPFFAAPAEAMRRIVGDQARRPQAAKRGGQADRVQPDEAALAAPEAGDDILAVHEALEQLAAIDAVAANRVKLRFFAGLNMGEAATALGMSVRSAQDIWVYARSCLHRKIRSD
jgi:hypothetical protein